MKTYVDVKKRTCLKCQKKFKSSWSGHRICEQCSKKNSKLPKYLLTSYGNEHKDAAQDKRTSREWN